MKAREPKHLRKKNNPNTFSVDELVSSNQLILFLIFYLLNKFYIIINQIRDLAMLKIKNANKLKINKGYLAKKRNFKVGSSDYWFKKILSSF